MQIIGVLYTPMIGTHVSCFLSLWGFFCLFVCLFCFVLFCFVVIEIKEDKEVLCIFLSLVQKESTV